MLIDLKTYGLIQRFEEESALYPNLFVARVIKQHKGLYKVVCIEGELDAHVLGKFSYNADQTSCFPTVGDWVMIDRTDDKHGTAAIHHVLKRKSLLSRQSAGTQKTEQPIAANIDTIFICMSLNADFNLRRIERYLSIAWDSMATPVIVLTKSDLCDDLHAKLTQVASSSIGVDVIVCSSMNEEGYSSIKSRIRPYETIAFIGSSGVGKSTLINRLLGEELLQTASIREEDDKGRHTTTYRQLLLLPDNGIVIDTPGMRELQIYAGDLMKAFEDIRELAAMCRYNNCSHENEPGCMVKKAVEENTLSLDRLESYRKLEREMSYSGLNSRQLENEKLRRMFGGKGEMKKIRDHIKNKNER